MSIQTLVHECSQALDSLLKRYPTQNFIVIGHSLGGSIASRIVEKIDPDQGGQINGLIVIDVVEGTALDALPFMMSLLNKRPKIFNSVEESINWALSSQTLKNKISARVSMQGQLQPCEKGFTWKIPLQESEKYWRGWFEGLSDSFLNVKVSKILFTAEK